MTGIESLMRIQDRASVDNIKEMTECFVSQLDPLKVILFGSFADGSYTDESDYDFYIVVNDGSNICEATDKAYRSVRYVKRRPLLERILALNAKETPGTPLWLRGRFPEMVYCSMIKWLIQRGGHLYE